MIISILGLSGAKLDANTCLPTQLHKPALYDLTLFKKESAHYANSTQFLLQNYDDDFIFIGTKCAITFQKKLLKEELKNKNVLFEQVSDNDLDDIFEKIYTHLEDKDDIILDITHGFRHQPIMAIFASTLSQFLDRKNIKIIFAKEEIPYKKYRYVYLDEYIEITQISFLLSGFIRTLNFIPSKNIKSLNNKAFENFSKSLLSNDLKGVEKNYTILKKAIDTLKANEEYRHIFKLLDQVGDELLLFEKFDKDTKPFQKYLALAKLTVTKNYLIVSLAYIFESFREYCVEGFSPVLKQVKLKSGYESNTAVMDTIGNFKRNGNKNKIQKSFPNLYNDNQSIFTRVSSIYKEVRTLRNDLAHINQTKNFGDIKQELNAIIFKIETLYKDEIFRKLQIKK
jgi:CRISPR-associated DxTHG motif protein